MGRDRTKRFESSKRPIVKARVLIDECCNQWRRCPKTNNWRGVVLINVSGVSSERFSIWTGITASTHKSDIYLNVVYCSR